MTVTRAQEWFLRGNHATSPIDAFTDYWRGFNFLYAARRERCDERSKIRNYLISAISSSSAHEILAINNQALSYLLCAPVVDMRGTGQDTQPAINTFTESTDPKVKLAALFMIIYQIRCNLEHGDKSPSAERDIKLCDASVPFVKAVLARCT